jgi:hypothetical protein
MKWSRLILMCEICRWKKFLIKANDSRRKDKKYFDFFFTQNEEETFTSPKWDVAHAAVLQVGFPATHLLPLQSFLKLFTTSYFLL